MAFILSSFFLCEQFGSRILMPKVCLEEQVAMILDEPS